MYYSAIGTIAVLILLIENMDILTGRITGSGSPARKTYRWFLFAVLAYYITDILWGMIESRKIAGLLFADTTLYFIAMAVGLLLWTKFVAQYMGEDSRMGWMLVYAGRLLAGAVAALSLINIFVPVLFTVSEDCVYSALPARYVMLAAQIALLLLISVNAVTVIFRREVAPKERKKYRTIAAFGFIMALFLTIQLWFAYLPVYSIAYMLGTCLIRVFVIRDVIEESRHELEEAEKILELQRSITTLMDNLPGISFSKVADTGVYLACNQAFADQVHRDSPDEVVGLTDYDLYDPEIAARFIEADKSAL